MRRIVWVVLALAAVAFVPVFFVVFQRLGEWWRGEKEIEAQKHRVGTPTDGDGHVAAATPAPVA